MKPIHDLLRDPFWIHYLQCLGWITARLLPMVVLTPVFGGQSVPPRVRFGTAVVFALGMSWAGVAAPAINWGMSNFLFLLLQELLVGAVLALAVMFAFQTFAACGACIDQLRGDQQATVYDPHIKRNESILSVFFVQLAVVLFLSMGGARTLFEAFGTSLVLFPPGQSIPDSLAGPSLADTFLRLSSGLFAIAVGLAAPVLIFTLLADIVLALAGRMAQRLDISAVSFTIKGTVAVTVLLLSMSTLLSVFERELVRMSGSLRTWASG